MRNVVAFKWVGVVLGGAFALASSACSTTPVSGGDLKVAIIDGEVVRSDGATSCNTWILFTTSISNSAGSCRSNEDIFALEDEVDAQATDAISQTCNGLGCVTSTIGNEGSFFECDPLSYTKHVWFKCTAQM